MAKVVVVAVVLGVFHLQGLANTDSATKRLKARDRSVFECMLLIEYAIWRKSDENVMSDSLSNKEGERRMPRIGLMDRRIVYR